MLSDFFWVIENEIAGMAMPTAGRAYAYLDEADEAAREEHAYEIEQLKEHGIGAVATLTEDPLSRTLFDESGMGYLHIPIPDMTAPTYSQIAAFVGFVNQHRENEQAVVAHCLAGYGRTGTMIACYLVSKGMTSREAIDLVRKRRHGAIETFLQEEAVIDFAIQHAQNGSL